MTTRRVLAEEGWVGLWRGNGLAVARAASSKAILFTSQDAFRVHLGSDIAAGSLAGIVATLVTYPLDLLRTRSAGAVGGGSVAEVARQVVAEGGVFALYRGMYATLLGAMVFEGTRFGSFGWLQDRTPDHWATPAVNGTLASLVAGGMLYPNDTIRRKLQYDKVTTSYLEAARALLKEGGFTRLYRGSGLYMVKSVPGAAIQFGVYHSLKRLSGDTSGRKKKQLR
ncbi:mitochondrial carrier domain-containing protein [Pavlovales sp. CCMP2436]|nr:mitochondrial carrier domain-containing protein [Pavlovales sp. CCMP2436]